MKEPQIYETSFPLVENIRREVIVKTEMRQNVKIYY